MLKMYEAWPAHATSAGLLMLHVDSYDKQIFGNSVDKDRCVGKQKNRRGTGATLVLLYTARVGHAAQGFDLYGVLPSQHIAALSSIPL